MDLHCGKKCVTLNPEEKQKYSDSFAGYIGQNALKIEPENFYVTEQYLTHECEIYNFKVDPSDVFVTSYLKTGSTWLQEIVWSILHNPNLDHPDVQEDPYAKTPMFEAPAVVPKELMLSVLLGCVSEEMNLFQSYDALKKPRVFKTHLLFSLHNPDVLNKAKVVYVVRNPMDTCLSYFHFARGLQAMRYQKSMESFVDDFIAGRIYAGSYVNHLKQWWAVKDRAHVHTVYYEKLKTNPENEMKKLGQFLGVELSEQQIANLVHYTSFNEMKKRDILAKSDKAREKFLVEGSKGFYRKGEVGASKDEMTKELRAKIAKHFKENLGEIKLPYDFSDGEIFEENIFKTSNCRPAV